jgi:hypothetical protein
MLSWFAPLKGRCVPFFPRLLCVDHHVPRHLARAEAQADRLAVSREPVAYGKLSGYTKVLWTACQQAAERAGLEQ